MSGSTSGGCSASIATMIGRADARARIARAVVGELLVAHCADARELLAVIRSQAPAVVVIDAVDANGCSNAPVVGSLRDEFPELAILVCCGLVPGASPSVLGCAQAGASGLLIDGVDDSRHAIHVAVRSARYTQVTSKVYDSVAAFLPSDLMPILRYAVSRAAEEPTVASAAASLGVDRKTLLNWLRRHTDVGPREFINWVRLAIAVSVLETTSWSAEHVALEFGFASGTSFRNMLRRYTGTTAAAARSSGGGRWMVQRFEARLELRSDGADTRRLTADRPQTRSA